MATLMMLHLGANWVLKRSCVACHCVLRACVYRCACKLVCVLAAYITGVCVCVCVYSIPVYTTG